MGSGISMTGREMDKQEDFVQKHFATAKKNMSKYKDGRNNRYSDMQIQMKLRKEYHNEPFRNVYQKPCDDSYIPQKEWNTWKDSY